MFKIELMIGEGTSIVYLDNEKETWLDEMEDFNDYWVNHNKIEISFNTGDNENVLIEKTWEMMYNLRNKELNYATIHNIEMIEGDWYIKHIWYKDKDIFNELLDDELLDVYNGGDFLDFSDFNSYDIMYKLFKDSNLINLLREYRLNDELGIN